MKTGANRLTLSNAGNSYAGETLIFGGTLQVGDGTTGAIPSSSTITVSSGASMNWVLGSSLTIANTITGSGNIGVTLTGAGSNLTIAASPVLTGTGTFTAGVAGNIIVNSGSSIAAAGGITLASGANFINNSGSSALSSSSGNWLVYSSAPSGNTFGGLDSGNTAIWNTAFVSGSSIPTLNAAVSGNRYVFAQAQNITITTTSDTTAYGTVKSLSGAFSISGANSAVANAFLADTTATSIFGSNGPTITSTGYLSGTQTNSVSGGPYTITASGGTPVNGSTISFQNSGTLTIGQRSLTVTADTQSRAYGASNPALTYTVGGSGLVNGDTLTGALSTSATTTSNVGSYSIGQNTLAASSNYALTY